MKYKLYKIKFLEVMFGNSEEEVVWVETEDEKNIYYTDGYDRWCYLEKDLEGKTYKTLDKTTKI
jgi:hypothetical protein